MKRLTLGLLLIVVLVLGLLGAALQSPRSVPTRSVAFRLTPTGKTQDRFRMISVVVSNISDYPVLFPAGFGQPWFGIQYRSNGVWSRTSVQTPGGGEELLRPHQVSQSTITIPEASKAVRLSLRITSLTWRGRFSLWLLEHRDLFLLGPLQGYLAREEYRKRSTTECSRVLGIPTPD